MSDKKKRSLSDIIADEPDLLRRVALIDFNMEFLKDPEEAILSYNMPSGFYTQWAEEHYQNLVQRAAQLTGADPKQLADKDKRTEEQYRAMLEISAQEQMARLEAVLRSNYHSAIKLIHEYCDALTGTHEAGDLYKILGVEYFPDEVRNGQLVNVPLAAALYFFANHAEVNPRMPDSLTAEHRSAIIEGFAALDEFYRAHRGELHSEQELLSAYLNRNTPKSPEATREALEHIALKRAELIEYPLDKVNSTIWGLLEQDTSKQIMIRAEKAGSKKEINILYSLDFDALGGAL